MSFQPVSIASIFRWRIKAKPEIFCLFLFLHLKMEASDTGERERHCLLLFLHLKMEANDTGEREALLTSIPPSKDGGK
jgi:hypothetical protein